MRVRVTATDVEVVVTSSDSGSNASSSAFREAWTHEIDPEPRDAPPPTPPAPASRRRSATGRSPISKARARTREQVVRVTVRKKGADMLAHWWRSGVKGGPEVDPPAFVDRSASKATERGAWEQAQEMFRERVKNRQLIEVDAHDVTRDAGDA